MPGGSEAATGPQLQFPHSKIPLDWRWQSVTPGGNQHRGHHPLQQVCESLHTAQTRKALSHKHCVELKLRQTFSGSRVSPKPRALHLEPAYGHEHHHLYRLTWYQTQNKLLCIKKSKTFKSTPLPSLTPPPHLFKVEKTTTTTKEAVVYDTMEYYSAIRNDKRRVRRVTFRSTCWVHVVVRVCAANQQCSLGTRSSTKKGLLLKTRKEERERTSFESFLIWKKHSKNHDFHYTVRE